MNPLPIVHTWRHEPTTDLTPVPMRDIEPGQVKPLALGFLDPEDNTVLFGDGGVGKGVVAAWLAARLTQAGDAVLVLDYEAHSRWEWRPRTDAFGAVIDNLFILQPKEPIWDIADTLRNDEIRFLRDGLLGQRKVWLFIDSATYACLGEEVEKSKTAAKYWTAIAAIGLPSLTLSHTTKTNADPQHPFGSVFWSNGARVTIGMSAPGPEIRRLANRKSNQRSKFAPVMIDWPDTTWEASGLPPTLSVATDTTSVASRAFDAMQDGVVYRASEVLALVNADGLTSTTLGALQNVLSRHGEWFWKPAYGRWGRATGVTVTRSGGTP